VVIEPETIKITGSYEKLMTVDQINTKEIDISNLQENLVTMVALENPEGVELLYSPSVQVLIQVEDTPITKTFSDVPVSTENLPEGMKAVLNKDKVNLTLKGSASKFLNLNSASIKAFIDLKGLEMGTHKVELKLVIPKELQVSQVEPGTIEVTISRQN
jgi:YbbR domain-containing protein